MVIVLIGLPGSGKGTHGEMIAKNKCLSYVSVGDIFRTISGSQSEEAAVISEYMSQGKLIPSDLVNKVVKEFLSLGKYKNACVLDGYPRNIEQAEFLRTFISEEVKAIYFEIDSSVVVKRILGRFSCANCGKIYNRYFIKPMIDNICDYCFGNEFVYRGDDDKETISKRIIEYKIETFPLISYYEEKGKVYAIDASKRKEEIEEDLERVLKII